MLICIQALVKPTRSIFPVSLLSAARSTEVLASLQRVAKGSKGISFFRFHIYEIMWCFCLSGIAVLKYYIVCHKFVYMLNRCKIKLKRKNSKESENLFLLMCLRYKQSHSPGRIMWLPQSCLGIPFCLGILVVICSS